jgi:site-specific DNA-methyltransferase (adenine-specific)
VSAPYWSDGTCSLYLGDCREALPDLGLTADLIVADPPYAETSLAWDRWPDGWLQACVPVASSLWCFGSMRMFLDRRDEFDGWKLSQDVIWEKNLGTGLAVDRFRRTHENALHWYRGVWGSIYHDSPREEWHGKNNGSRNRGGSKGYHLGEAGNRDYTDDGTRLLRSIIKAANLHKRGIHPTEKPVGILTPLIEYACPPGGQVIDPFAGSGSTLEAARLTGRRAIGIERHEPYIEAAALRLSQAPLELA